VKGTCREQHCTYRIDCDSRGFGYWNAACVAICEQLWVLPERGIGVGVVDFDYFVVDGETLTDALPFGSGLTGGR
jgi:hypothetical protein